MKGTLHLKKTPEGPLFYVLAQAREGDVLSIPCLVYYESDDASGGVYDSVSLYAGVLLVAKSHVVISRLHERIEDVEPIAGTRIYNGHRHVVLYDEHERAVPWHANRTCRLLTQRRPGLGEEYLMTLTPVGPTDATH